MYLTKIKIENIRSVGDLEWQPPKSQLPGWHVIIGDNGSGKTSFLRSVALALVGPTDALALRQNWNDWLRRESDEGTIEIYIKIDHSLDKFSGSGKVPTKWLPYFSVRFRRAQEPLRPIGGVFQFNPERFVWGGKAGWFSASYGPFRRFAGGDKDTEKLFYSELRLARHLSVFGEGVALSECLKWLQQLQFKSLEEQTYPSRQNGASSLLERIVSFINESDLLPHQTRLAEISSDEVTFVDGNGCRVRVEELSDGYRSILSMTFELIRQLHATYGPDGIFNTKQRAVVDPPGVVLIDEIDAHLHPTWQRRVGGWFREHFPNLQFIVTTHSPLICQAAHEGSVFRLPRPGSDDRGEMLKGATLDRLLYGNVLDAYSTDEFGRDVGRSEEGRRLLARLGELNQKELLKKLSAAERRERDALRARFPTQAHALDGER